MVTNSVPEVVKTVTLPQEKVKYTVQVSRYPNAKSGYWNFCGDIETESRLNLYLKEAKIRWPQNKGWKIRVKRHVYKVVTTQATQLIKTDFLVPSNTPQGI